ncbi:hypothetical protein Tco_1218959 [Tanacetum coccineum]
MIVEKSETPSTPPLASTPWLLGSLVCPLALPLGSPVLPPPLPVRPPILSPRGAAVDQLALCVVILGGIIYTREDIGDDTSLKITIPKMLKFKIESQYKVSQNMIHTGFSYGLLKFALDFTDL